MDIEKESTLVQFGDWCYYVESHNLNQLYLRFLHCQQGSIISMG